MDFLEKAQKLSEKANVSLEEAKAALTASNEDILDAMILLEKQGKTQTSGKSEFKTTAEESKLLPEVSSQPEAQSNTEGFGTKFVRIVRGLWKKCSENFFVVERKENVLLKIPVWVLLLILLVAWHTALVLIIVGLFFGCRYAFKGEDDLTKVNECFDKAAEFADDVKVHVENLGKEDNK